jgi:hypothetical protein
MENVGEELEGELKASVMVGLIEVKLQPWVL